MYQTLDSSVCPSRHIVPAPASVTQHEEEAMGESTEIRLGTGLEKACEFCHASEATEWTVAMDHLKAMFGTVDKHTLTASGITARNNGQYRPTEGGHRHIIKLFNAATSSLAPVKLRKASPL